MGCGPFVQSEKGSWRHKASWEWAHLAEMACVLPSGDDGAELIIADNFDGLSVRNANWGLSQKEEETAIQTEANQA